MRLRTNLTLQLIMWGALLLTSAMVAQTGLVRLPADFVATNAVIEPVKLGLGYTEGPAIDAAGNLYFSEFGQPHKIWKVTPNGKAEVFRSDSHDSNGLAIDSKDRLVITQRGRIVRVEKDGRETVLAKDYDDLIPETNDLTLNTNGDLYFTNPVMGGLGRVFYLKSDGTLKVVLSGLKHPNGIKWVPEKSMLYLGVYADDKILKYEVQPDGSLVNPQLFAELARPDGMTMDVQAHLYVASHRDHTVKVYNSSGENLGQIVINARNVSNCAFGGPDNKTLYITGDGGVWRIGLKIAGRRYL